MLSVLQSEDRDCYLLYFLESLSPTLSKFENPSVDNEKHKRRNQHCCKKRVLF